MNIWYNLAAERGVSGSPNRLNTTADTGLVMSKIDVSNFYLQKQAVCRVCSEVKPQSEYYERQLRKCGTVGECKECTKARVKKRAQSDPKVREYDRKRSKTPKRKEHIAKNARKWNEKHPDAYRAHYLVSNAVRDGRLEKEPCLFCGAGKVHAHHRDYSKPLSVIWLCPKCHHRLHANFPETAAHERSSR